MKRAITLIIGMLALFCLGFVVWGCIKAALMQEIAEGEMELNSDYSDTSEFDAKLYEMAYSSPVAADRIGLWLEAILSRKFETFSCNGQSFSPKLSKKLSGWPLNRTVEVDLSDSGASEESILKLGPLPNTEWVDLSGTKATEKAVLSVLKNTPKLRRLELRDTAINWNQQLVDSLLAHPELKRVDLNERTLDPADLAKLKTGLSSRTN